ncbi:SPW repeat protein [Saccharopolyspora sp. MS10]|uniref:SPW repeat protein n=1 Tax=Saccharopolyspora sp. MS10 TaxID=3385973 RepID=UPI0039A245A3
MAQRSSHEASMRDHPDVVSLQRQYGGTLGSPQTVAADGIVALAGLWAALSPWVLGFNATEPAMRTHNLILGLVAVGIGLGVTGLFERGGGISWVLVPLGIWLIISTWIVPAAAPTVGMVWSNVVAGALLALAGAGTLGMALLGNRAQ